MTLRQYQALRERVKSKPMYWQQRAMMDFGRRLNDYIEQYDLQDKAEQACVRHGIDLVDVICGDEDLTFTEMTLILHEIGAKVDFEITEQD